MTSRCTVRRKAGGKTVVDGFEEDFTWTTVYTDLPVRVSSGRGAPASRQQSSGGINVEVPIRTASFPYDTDDLSDGDLVEVTDGDTEGLVFRIVDADPQDQATARRVQIIGTDRPGEWV